ncbi:endonuclease [Arenicella sp. 4NH20-0111]|uniref:HNH endonuclease signature motif containing protein n=1 Tax=Arenicella sp. 4NH20-0111 TaxID=3127648 RepID=UPI0031096022
MKYYEYPATILTTIGLLLSTITFMTHAQIANNGFEAWSSSGPVSWSTIDSGIQVTQASSPRVDGASSAQVTVNTRTQSNTDFTQQIDLLANQTYDFQASIYHTEGHVRARLIVDGYRTYSDPSRLNEWQTIEYSYTPTSDESISVGLRFYDLSSFDGEEIVYVDYFRPSNQVPPPPPGCTETEVVVNVTTDNYGSETAWQLFNSDNQILGGGSNLQNNTSTNTDFCLVDGDYHLTITDSYGDGICCSYGNGQYSISANGQTLASGGEFAYSETSTFTIGGNNSAPNDYYDSATGLTGLNLKTALHNIIKDHAVQGYGALWGFYSATELDLYYENDGSILDIYSENPVSSDPYNYNAITDQCGGYSNEGDCYNREHSFPRSWFGGSVEPMNSDVHHIFASDGKVNSIRSSYPYGEVSNPSTVTNNGSKLGTESGYGYGSTVFEPIDEFKGDIARAQFYVATRYQSSIASWENNSSYSNAALNGTAGYAFENWYVNLLKSWHQQDPVSQKERDRNDDAFIYQGNRNPFIDHPEYVNAIWQ